MRAGVLASIALAALSVATATQAELNSAQRVRAFAKLPDWSGLWEQYDIGPSGLPPPPTAADLEQPPYNAAWAAKYRASVEAQAAQPPPLQCLTGFPTLMVGSPLMFQAIVTPEETTLIFSQRETRHIYTDDSPHPDKDSLWPMPWGDSIGHWQGQVLVADTVATSSPLFRIVPIKGGFTGGWAVFSDQAHYAERIRMADKDTLEDQITIEDPVALTHPWSLTRRFHRVPRMTRIIDGDCRGNDRNPVVDGKFVIAPP